MVYWWVLVHYGPFKGLYIKCKNGIELWLQRKRLINLLLGSFQCSIYFSLPGFILAFLYTHPQIWVLDLLTLAFTHITHPTNHSNDLLTQHWYEPSITSGKISYPWNKGQTTVKYFRHFKEKKTTFWVASKETMGGKAFQWSIYSIRNPWFNYMLIQRIY
jgi:hypothetical protein